MAAALLFSNESNLCTQLHGAKSMERDALPAWAELRDCIGVGEDQRYSEDQLEYLQYHYTKDKAVLLFRCSHFIANVPKVLGVFVPGQWAPIDQERTRGLNGSPLTCRTRGFYRPIDL